MSVRYLGIDTETGKYLRLEKGVGTNISFTTTVSTGDTVSFTKEQLGIETEVQFDLIDSTGTVVTTDQHLTRQWVNGVLYLTWDGGWSVGDWTLMPTGIQGVPGPQGPEGPPGSAYVLPTASTTTLGGVKIDGTTITISDQVISATQITVDSQLDESSSNPVENRVVTQALSQKASTDVATTESAGLMSAQDKSKLEGLVDGYLGYYATDTALRTAHPTGENGQFASIGSTDTIWAWDSDTSSWVNTDTNTVTVSWDNVSGKPNFATVATSGSYNDLLNKPTIPDPYTLPTASTTTLGGVKIDGTTITISDGVITATAQSGDSVGNLVFIRPVSDMALYPVVEASQTAAFSTTTVLDTLNTAGDRQYVSVFTGTQWLSFPSGGLGTPFDNLPVSVDMSKFSALTKPYYVRCCWVSQDESDSSSSDVSTDYVGTVFPSVGIPSSVGGSSEYVLPTASTTVLGGVKIDGATITIADGVISATQITVDSQLDESSSNPVQNAVVTQALSQKASTAVATTESSGLMSAQDKTKLNGLENYTLPTASTSVLGGVKVDGTTVTISDGVISATASSGDSINRLSFIRPVSDLALYPVVEASQNADFTSSILLDTFNTAGDRQYVSVFTGTQWLSFPSGGLGTPFDNLPVSVDMSKFSALTKPYYVRCCWSYEESGSESSSEGYTDQISIQFPAVGIPSSVGGSSEYVLPTASTNTLGGVKIDGTTITIADGVISATAPLITVDDHLDESSSNPVENRVVTQALSQKATTAVATTEAAGLMSAADKTKLNGLENYTLPTASTSTKGGVKVDGTTVTIAGDVITAEQTYLRQLVSANGALTNREWAVCTADCTLTLPEAVAGYYIRVSTTSSVNSVVVTPYSGDTIDGDSAGFTLNTDNASVEFYGISGGWRVSDVSGVLNGAFPVGTIFAYASSTPPTGAFLLNGQIISSCQSLYPEFWAWLNTEVTASRVRAATDEDYTAELTAKGNCGAFVLNTGGTTGAVRLPSVTTGFIQGVSGNIGQTEAAGIPNLNGTFYTFGDANSTYTSGPIYVTGPIGPDAAISGTSIPKRQSVNFDASRVSSVYNNSTTVQPPSVHYSLCIQVYHASTALSTQQAAQLASEMQTKAGVNLSNLTPGGKGVISDTALELDWDNAVDITVQTQYHASRSGLVTLRGNNTSSDFWVALIKWGPNMDGSSTGSNYFSGNSLYAPANSYILASLPVTKGEYYMVQMKTGSTTAYAKFTPLKNSIEDSSSSS